MRQPSRCPPSGDGRPARGRHLRPRGAHELERPEVDLRGDPGVEDPRGVLGVVAAEVGDEPVRAVHVDAAPAAGPEKRLEEALGVVVTARSLGVAVGPGDRGVAAHRAAGLLDRERHRSREPGGADPLLRGRAGPARRGGTTGRAGAGRESRRRSPRLAGSRSRSPFSHRDHAHRARRAPADPSESRAWPRSPSSARRCCRPRPRPPRSRHAAAAREIAWVRVLRSRVPALDALEDGDVVIASAAVSGVVAGSAEDAGALADALAGRAAALIVTGGEHGAPADALVDASCARGIPVLRLPDADAAALERSVIAWLVNRRAALDEQAAALERRLEALALGGADLAELVAAFGAFLGRAAVLEGRRGDALAVHAPAEIPAAAAAASRFLATGAGVALRVALPLAPLDPSRRPDLARYGEPALRGSLLLLGDGPIGELERTATDRAAALLALELSRDAAVHRARETARRSEALPADGPPWVVLVARQVGREDVEQAEQREAFRAELRMLAPNRQAHPARRLREPRVSPRRRRRRGRPAGARDRRAGGRLPPPLRRRLAPLHRFRRPARRRGRRPGHPRGRRTLRVRPARRPRRSRRRLPASRQPAQPARRPGARPGPPRAAPRGTPGPRGRAARDAAGGAGPAGAGRGRGRPRRPPQHDRLPDPADRIARRLGPPGSRAAPLARGGRPDCAKSTDRRPIPQPPDG